MSNDGLPRWYDFWKQAYDQSLVRFECSQCGEVTETPQMECPTCRCTDFDCYDLLDPENKEYTLGDDENE